MDTKISTATEEVFGKSKMSIIEVFHFNRIIIVSICLRKYLHGMESVAIISCNVSRILWFPMKVGIKSMLI